MRRGLASIAGVDEVGRGPIAGPVCAAAVILDPKHIPEGLNDSKQLAREQRDVLYEAIMASALSVGIAFVSAAEIDVINIRQATFVAMRRSLAALSVRPGYVLIDGKDVPQDLICDGEALIKGDGSSASIAAASIIAKVTRDRLMRRLCTVHPAYGFRHHVGYATRAHLAALAEHGPCTYHRSSFGFVRMLVAANRRDQGNAD